MQEAITKAATLVEAHGYIREFRDKVVVVKVGGSIMDNPADLASLLGDICFMHSVGMRPLVVHGGGKAINAAMADAGLEAQFVQGRRYTDERTLAIAEHVLVNDINAAAVGHMLAAGTPAMGFHSLGSCVIFARRLALTGENNRRIDIGMVGQVEWVNAELLRAVMAAGTVPVIAPIARDPAGGKLNINADSVAGHVAAALRAEKVVLVSDTHGIRTDPLKDETASTLTRDETDGLIRSGVIDGGMLPKVEAALTALGGGCRKAHIVDGRIPHALLLEVYTEAGIGTEIVL